MALSAARCDLHGAFSQEKMSSGLNQLLRSGGNGARGSLDRFCCLRVPSNPEPVLLSAVRPCSPRWSFQPGTLRLTNPSNLAELCRSILQPGENGDVPNQGTRSPRTGLHGGVFEPPCVRGEVGHPSHDQPASRVSQWSHVVSDSLLLRPAHFAVGEFDLELWRHPDADRPALALDQWQ